MALPLNNIVKGQITQTLLSILLERGGYRVTRLGVEELFGEIKYLGQSEYLALRLPERLRFLPDLLVANPEVTQAYLVEVKFRARFDAQSASQLHEQLTKQQVHWPESYTVLMISEPLFVGGRFHQDYIRVVKPGQLDRLVASGVTPEAIWNNLPQIYHAFPLLSETKLLYEADALVSALKMLSNLTDPLLISPITIPQLIIPVAIGPAK